jgi:hypothetical protein
MVREPDDIDTDDIDDDHDDDIDDDDERDDDDSDSGDDDNRRSRRNESDDKNREKDTPSARRALRRERSRVRQLTAKIDQLSELMRKNGIGSDAVEKATRRTRTNGSRQEPVDVDAIRREVTEELTSKFREDSNARSIASSAVLALGEAGYIGKARRGVRQLDLTGVTVDEDGNVDEDELLDAIEDLKEESPELFRPSRRNRSARTSERQRDRDDDEEFDERDSKGDRPRRDRSEGMGRGRGGRPPQDSLERALIAMVGGARRRER